MAKYDLKEGEYDVAGAKLGIVAARFNAHIVDKLLDGAMAACARHGLGDDAVTLVRVPGAFEIAVTAKRLAVSGGYDAIVTLGAVVRGGTPHFEYVAGECARGVNDVGISENLPVIFGVLTVDDDQQALERAGGSEGNKGEEAALAALEMISVLRALARAG